MENTNKKELIKTKKEGRSIFKSFLSLCIYIVIGIVIALTVRAVVEPTVVVGHSMETDLHDGQYMLDLKTAYLFNNPKYGDVVIVNTKGILPEDFIIKRVIGVSGDTIEIKNNQLYRNGKHIQEDYIAEPMKGNTDMKVKLGKDQYFVMGDNRNDSLDSRVFGPVTKERIRGEVVLRLFPFDQSYKNGNFNLTAAQ